MTSPPPSRRWLGVLTAVSLAAAVAGGCGSSGSDDAGGEGSSGAGDGSIEAGGSGGAEVPGTGDETFVGLGTAAIDVSSYDLDLGWDPGAAVLDATATLTLTRTVPGDTVPLDFGDLAVESVAVSVDGGEAAEATFAQRDDDLVVSLDGEVDAGVPIVVTVDYGGAPTGVTSSAPVPVGWLVLEDGSVATPSEPDAAHSWFPCNDHPTDKATFRTTIRAPEGLTAIGNGVREGSSTEGGRTTTTWVMDAPMAPYLALVAIGDFDERPGGTSAGVPLVDYVPTGQGGTFSGGLGQQSTMMSFLVDRLGPYPFAEYGAVVVPGSNAALETQGRSLFFGPSARDRGTVVHEMAHQWIGDSVSLTHWGRDIWWVEGFARFTEWLWWERVEGRDGYTGRAEIAYTGLGFGDRLAIGDLSAGDLFDRQTYDGGALVFYALRAELGDEVFFGAMRTFAERYRHANATTDDLFAVFAEAAGRDVRPSVETLLSGGELPALTF